MTRLALVLVLACGGTKEAASKGPAYTPAIAYELAVLAPSCDLTTTAITEIRTCKGNHASAVISLDGRRHLVKLEIELNAWNTQLARGRLDRALAPLLPATVLAKLDAGLGQPVNQGSVEGVTFRSTKSSDELAHYELTISW